MAAAGQRHNVSDAGAAQVAALPIVWVLLMLWLLPMVWALWTHAVLCRAGPRCCEPPLLACALQADGERHGS